MPQQRRLDHILADDYLDGLDDRSPDELRAMRRDCQAEESMLSFGRRVLHGRLDLVRAELQRRAVGGTRELTALLAELADEPGGGSERSVSHVTIDHHDQIVLEGNRALDLQDEPLLSRLAEASEEDLREAVDRWLELEREISAARTRVHRRLDAVQSALVEAYRSGAAHVDDVLRGPGG